ncbi:MAG: hypothetical protein QXH27_05840 [Candidatus Micrarchaeia archaeon]
MSDEEEEFFENLLKAYAKALRGNSPEPLREFREARRKIENSYEALKKLLESLRKSGKIEERDYFALYSELVSIAAGAYATGDYSKMKEFENRISKSEFTVLEEGVP